MANVILIAGGAGYIGSHVCKALSAAGYIPLTLDNLSTGREEFVRWGPLVKACVSEAEIVRHMIAEHNIDTVIDLAGSIEVGESILNPIKYYQNNVAAKIVFLRTLQECGVKSYVFSSSAAVYGEPATIPIPEVHALLPKNPYGWSKLMFEQILRDFQTAGGPRWIALRYFNAAGAAMNASIGESHNPETHLIPRAYAAALGAAQALEIYGNDYPTPDGTAIRDYVHVEDLAAAHLLAIDALAKNSPSHAYNLGSGTGFSVKEILACFERLGQSVPHNFMPRRAGDPARLVADATSARQMLGWIPHYSDIETIIRSAYSWHKSQIQPR